MSLRKHVVKIIQANDPNIDHIDLSNLGLFDEDVEELVGLLASNPYITSLNLSQNNIRSNGAKALAQLPNLKTLDISENGIGDLGVKYLLRNNSIKWLDLSDNGITDEGARRILKVVARYEHLEVDGDDIKDKKLFKKIVQSLEEARLPKVYSPSLFGHRTAEKATTVPAAKRLVDLSKSLRALDSQAFIDDYFRPSIPVPSK